MRPRVWTYNKATNAGLIIAHFHVVIQHIKKVLTDGF